MARGRRLVTFGRPLKKHAQGLRAVAPRRRDARRQTVAGGRADHQYVLRSGLACGNFPTHPFNPLSDVAAASFRMRVYTNEAARAALDDLLRHIRSPIR